MTAPLSDDARAIAGGLFGSPLPCLHSARYEHPAQISPRAFAALSELVEAGIIRCDIGLTSLTYVQLEDCRHHNDWLRSVMHTGIGSLALTRAGERR